MTTQLIRLTFLVSSILFSACHSDNAISTDERTAVENIVKTVTDACNRHDTTQLMSVVDESLNYKREFSSGSPPAIGGYFELAHNVNVTFAKHYDYRYEAKLTNISKDEHGWVKAYLIVNEDSSRGEDYPQQTHQVWTIKRLNQTWKVIHIYITD